MSEHGWFHPSQGYWQTTGFPPAEFFNAYPEGTIEVPVKPGAGFEYDAGANVWNEVQLPIDPDIRLALIKAECRRRIYAVASAEAQMNINGVAAVISAKPEASRTGDDVSMLAAFRLSVEWIAEMRGRVALVAADPALDFSQDENWPSCPDGVAVLGKQY